MQFDWSGMPSTLQTRMTERLESHLAGMTERELCKSLLGIGGMGNRVPDELLARVLGELSDGLKSTWDMHNFATIL